MMKQCYMFAKGSVHIFLTLIVPYLFTVLLFLASACKSKQCLKESCGVGVRFNGAHLSMLQGYKRVIKSSQGLVKSDRMNAALKKTRDP